MSYYGHHRPAATTVEETLGGLALLVHKYKTHIAPPVNPRVELLIQEAKATVAREALEAENNPEPKRSFFSLFY